MVTSDGGGPALPSFAGDSRGSMVDLYQSLACLAARQWPRTVRSGVAAKRRLDPRRCGISNRLFDGAHCELPHHVGGLTMQVLGSVAFGVMTVVNLVVLAAVLYGMFHRSK